MTTEATTTHQAAKPESTDGRDGFTREDIAGMARDLGWDAEKEQEVWDNLQASIAREERLTAKGLKVSYRKALLRITNTRWSHGGRLQDGTCHYQHQTTVSGNTYPVKDALKAAGYRWHPGDRLWYRPIAAGTSIHDNLEETKDLLA